MATECDFEALAQELSAAIDGASSVDRDRILREWCTTITASHGAACFARVQVLVTLYNNAHEVGIQKGVKMAGDSNKIDTRFFGIGIIMLLTAIGFAIWGFAQRSLEPDQRMILMWVLPLASGFGAGAFVGSLTVTSKGWVPGLIATATGGFGVWLITFFFLPKPEANNNRSSVEEYRKYVNQTHAANVAQLERAAEKDLENAETISRGIEQLESAKGKLDESISDGHLMSSAVHREEYNKQVDEISAIKPQEPQGGESSGGGSEGGGRLAFELLPIQHISKIAGYLERVNAE